MIETSIKSIEEEIQKFWKEKDIFKKSLKIREGEKKFVFYEGPPTANGLPHIGHFLTRAFKDLFLRYKTMRGFYVPRKSGWDTHGLPVELEVEKELGINKKSNIEKYGIAKFNKKAKESVWRYKKEWERFTKKMGFWIDLDNPYITYSSSYIETLWWIIKQIYNKKLLYKGYKVLPWCTRCGTALSSHEVALGYKKVKENSIYVRFFVKSNKSEWKNTSILSWTTTPWTLPGNVALAVNPKIKYVKVPDPNLRNHWLILGYENLKKLAEEGILPDYNNKKLKTFLGKEIVGIEYKPLFDIRELKSETSYKVYPADFVTTEEGTGIVHTAVMYGEDDYELGKKNNLPMFHTVDRDGNFNDSVGKELAGKYVKDSKTEKIIIDILNKKKFLLKEEMYEHDYPFCWRCKTPLLYYADESWFVKISAVKDKLIANNKKINWYPNYIKEGRFGQWLKEIKDWAFSRDRYWGTPLPVWQCKNKNCGSYKIIGSFEEIHQSAYKKPNTYYYIRHGLSTKNEKGIISSRIENDRYKLTEEGRREVQKEAEKLKRNGGVDIIVSSPFLRARQTAEIIAKTLNLDVTIDDRLSEIKHDSQCEGKTQHVCLPPDGKFPADLNYRFGDGESWMDVRKRIAELLTYLNEKYEGKKILLVGHGDPLMILDAIVSRKSDKELAEILAATSSKDESYSSRKRSEKKKLGYPQKGKLKKLKYIYGPYNEEGYLDPHRPYIDKIILKCDKCGGKAGRVRDVVDVWFDSGSMPLAQESFPFSCSKIKISKITAGSVKKCVDFPADFICEGIDQTRGWFYTLLAVSTLLDLGPSYKNVISLGHVLDEKGRKMSKSLGNIVSPDYVIEKFGSDTVRWWFYKVNQAGEPKRFKEEELREIGSEFLRVVLNSLRFWKLYQGKGKRKKEKGKTEKVKREKDLLDRWLLSKYNSLVKSVTQSLDNYNATSASREIEKFTVEDLSNWWIRRNRIYFQSEGSFQKQELLRSMLTELSKLIAPFMPFLAEYLYKEISSQNLLSVHLSDWPEFDKRMIDKKLENQMEIVRKIVRLGLALRKKAEIKVRQPLSCLWIEFKDKKLNIQKELLNLIKDEVNIKNIVLVRTGQEISSDSKHLQLVEDNLVVTLNTEITPSLQSEGWVREFTRIIQDARKDAGYKYTDRITCFWFTEDHDLTRAILNNERFIRDKALIKEFQNLPHNPESIYDIEREFKIGSRKKVWVGLKK